MGVFYDETDSTYIVSAINQVIKTTVTNSGDVVSDWINDILRIHHRRLDHLIVGLDIEWCPNTSINEENPVALLQLCVGHRCLIFQLIHCDYIPDKLDVFFLDDRFRFVGVGIGDDSEKLKRHYELEVKNASDLRDFAAAKMGRQEMKWGLRILVREVMGVDMEKPKSVRISNWARSLLRKEQIEYAAVDAFASFEVGRRLADVRERKASRRDCFGLFWFLFWFLFFELVLRENEKLAG